MRDLPREYLLFPLHYTSLAKRPSEMKMVEKGKTGGDSSNSLMNNVYI